MEFCRAGGALLRSSARTTSSSSTSTLSHTQLQCLRRGTSIESRHIRASLSNRSFSSTVPVRAELPPSPPNEAQTEAEPQLRKVSPGISEHDLDKSSTQRLNSLFSADEKATADYLRGARVPSLEQSYSRAEAAKERGRSSSGIDILATLTETMGKNQQKQFQNTEFGSAHHNSTNKKNKGLSPATPSSSLNSRFNDGTGWSDMIDIVPPRDDGPQMAYPTLNSSTGRSVPIKPGTSVSDLGLALGKLEYLCGVNRVKADFNKQRFHERPGLKRKRLKSVRWNKRFRAGFQYMTARIETLRKQGW